MRGGRWILAIGTWTACTAALSALGIVKVNELRTDLLRSVRQPAVQPAGSPSPSPSADPAHVLSTPGGSVVARCDTGQVRVLWMSPADGFRIEDADQAPGPQVRLTFKTDGQEVRVVVHCVQDVPQADVTLG